MRDHCTYLEEGEWVHFAFPYNRNTVDAIKQSIPPEGRDYNPTTKWWSVTHEWFEVMCAVLNQTLSNCVIFEVHTEDGMDAQ
jgi:hypothetical protein